MKAFRSLAMLFVAVSSMAAATPFITSLAPSSATAGDPALTLSVNGVNIQAGAAVVWNGMSLASSYVSATLLTASVPANLLANQGYANVTVMNPGGVVSPVATFAIVAAPLSVATASLPGAVAGTAYSAVLAATGGTAPYTWTAISPLPSGLSLSTGGAVGGTPVSVGTTNVTVQVTDRTGASVTRTLSIAVSAPPLTISTAAALPDATLGSAYSQPLTATGGLPPYRWNAAGALPDGLSVANAGISGTPSTRGTYALAVAVTDSAGSTSTRTFSLKVNPAPLAIVTDAPLFNATAGAFYAQTIAASGGVSPYTWAISSGQLPAGIALDGKTGSLSGTPSTTGTSTVAVQVTDSLGTVASRTYTLTVDPPKLTITTPATLAAGTVGTGYTQQFTTDGGKAPYSWRIASGAIPGLALDSGSGVLSNTPLQAGSFSFTVQVTDANGSTASRTFSLTINPLPLSVVTKTDLPGGAIGVAYSASIAASGGTPPYTWSGNGLPAGLTLDSTSGLLSGAPTAAGTLTFTVRVTDSARATATVLMKLVVSLPPAPDVLISGLPGTVDPAAQYTVRLSLAGPYPVDIGGQLLLTFAPDGGIGDPAIQFSTGGRAVAFTIPAGNTDADIAGGSLGLQSGTVAGTIRIAAQLNATGQDITPASAAPVSGTVAAAPPAVTSAVLTRGSGTLTVTIAGYATAREVTQAVFRFKPASGKTLQQTEITLATDSLFGDWFQSTASARTGGQFLFQQTFTIQGDSSAVLPDSVTLFNRIGSSTAAMQ